MASEARIELERRIAAGEVDEDGVEFKLPHPMAVSSSGADSMPGGR
jgi:hypothetical protein